jgi:hypothetical protein
VDDSESFVRRGDELRGVISADRRFGPTLQRSGLGGDGRVYACNEIDGGFDQSINELQIVRR